MSETVKHKLRIVLGSSQDTDESILNRQSSERQNHQNGTSNAGKSPTRDLGPPKTSPYHTQTSHKPMDHLRNLLRYLGLAETRENLGYTDLDEELKQQEIERASTRLSFLLTSLVVVLVLLGATMVLSTSFVASLGKSGTGSPFAIFERQFLWIVIGLGLYFVFARVNPKRFAPYSRWMLPPVILVLLFVLVPGVGVTVGGSSRWVGFSSFRIQPSEFAKLAVVLFLSGFLTPAVPERLRSLRAVFPAIWLVGLTAMLILIEPDMGTSLVVGTILLGVLFLAGMRMRIYLPFVLVTVSGAVFAALYEPYRRDRLLSFFHPWQNRFVFSYQEVQGLAAFANGGATGVGLGAGSAKWGYLPNSQTDFIFAVIGQEAGLIGCLVVLGLLSALCVVVIKIGLRAGSRFEFLLCSGVAIWIASQSIFNVGAVLGVFPVTGVPLPLISAGGSSLTILLLSLGLVSGVARRPGQMFSARATRSYQRL